jgi:hypothetical protein
LAEVAGDLTGGDEFREGRPGAVEEPLAGLGQTDAACRAGEERSAQPRFQAANRLAHGRRRHAKLRSGAAEAAAAGDREEGFDTFQRATSDCVAPLHRP